MASTAKIIAGVREECADAAPNISRILNLCNRCVKTVAGGIILPDNSLSLPLDNLRHQADVTTSTTNPYVALPTTAGSVYQRGLFKITSDAQNGDVVKIAESWQQFVDQFEDLDEAGYAYRACVRGERLYYQGIPASADTLTLHYYREPVDRAVTTIESAATISFAASNNRISDSGDGLGSAAADDELVVIGSTLNDGHYTVASVPGDGSYIAVNEPLQTESAGATVSVYKANDAPDGIPKHLQEEIVTNWVCWNIFKRIEKGIKGRKIQTSEYKNLFYEAMASLQRFTTPDGEPYNMAMDPDDYI